MSDASSKTDLDRQLVSTMKEHEVRNWIAWLGCIGTEFPVAVKAVGTPQAMFTTTSAIQSGNAFASTG